MLPVNLSCGGGLLSAAGFGPYPRGTIIRAIHADIVASNPAGFGPSVVAMIPALFRQSPPQSLNEFASTGLELVKGSSGVSGNVPAIDIALETQLVFDSTGAVLQTYYFARHGIILPLNVRLRDYSYLGVGFFEGGSSYRVSVSVDAILPDKDMLEF